MVKGPGSGFTDMASNSDSVSSWLWLKFLPQRATMRIKRVDHAARSLASSSKVPLQKRPGSALYHSHDDTPLKIFSPISCSLFFLHSRHSHLQHFPRLLGPGLLHNVLLPSHSPLLTPKYLLDLCIGVSCMEETVPNCQGWRRYLLCVSNTFTLKNIYFCFTDYAKAFRLCGSQQTVEILKEMEYQTTLLACWETCTKVKKQQLEPDMEQQTGLKLGKEYIRLYIVTLLI